MSINQIIARWEQRPFERGVTDCCAFVNYVVKEITGRDCLPYYKDDLGALDIIDRHASLKNAVTHYFGKAPVDVGLLVPGDIALLEIADNQTIGIVMDTGNVAVIFEGAGLRETSMGFVDEGWQVWV